MIYKNFILASIFLLVSLLTAINYRVSIPEVRIIDVNKGSSTNQISNYLRKEKLIISSRLFNFYARVFSIDNDFKAGEFLLDSSESIYSLGSKISEGQNYFRKFTILPGVSYNQIIDYGIKVGLTNDVDAFPSELEIGEGLFYPDTYFFLKGDSLSKLLLESQKKWKLITDELWKTRRKELPYQSLKEAVTLASIIEKEGSEKEMIAGVFINRLNAGMKLQSDPTVIYALGSNFDGDIKKKDLRLDKPYNTYRYKGLPPGPISTVSEDSLKAALNPLKTDFLYFVSMGNGFHKFSKTLSEHNEAVLKYQINGR